MSNLFADHPLVAMVRKLELWQPLTKTEQEAIVALPHVCRDLKASQYLVWDGDRPQNSCVLLSGFACRHKLGGNGSRQIVSIHMKGDIVDLQNSLLGVADHNVQMLTPGRIAMVQVEAMRELAAAYPAVGMAMWFETLVEASIFREWILNIGRRDARTRIAHLLCEFAVRMEAAGLGKSATYELPITQEQLADAVALTAVHVNRTLMRLEEDGLIRRTKRLITIADWAQLAKTADFQPRYLHLGLDNAVPDRPASPVRATS